MPRYRVVTSSDTAGGFAMFTASSDDDARKQASEIASYLPPGGRVISLSEDMPFDRTRRVSLDPETYER